MVERQRKISVLLSEQEFQQLDKFCELNGYKKSTLVVRLLREFIAKNPIKDVNISELKNQG